MKKAKVSGEGEPNIPEVPQDENIIEPATNPLLVDLILDKILHMLFDPLKGSDHETKAAIVKNVQNIRLVCNLWRIRATSIFKDLRSPVVLGPPKGRPNTSDGVDSPPNVDFQRYVQTMKYSCIIPATRYQIWIRAQTFKDASNQKWFNYFWSICGPKMTSLEVITRNLDSTLQFLEVEDGRLLNLPNLTTLTIHANNNSNPRATGIRTWPDVGSLLQLVVASAKNLQNLTVNYKPAASGAEEKRCADVVASVSPTMKKFELVLSEMEFSPKYLESLITNNVKLEELKISDNSTWPTSCDTNLFRRFFKIQSETLKILRWPTSIHSLPPEGFPKMKQLTELTLNGGSAVPFSFPESFPKLKVLDLRNLRRSSSLQLISLTNATRSVEELYFPAGEKQNSELARKMVKIFPAVKRLHVFNVNNHYPDILPVVFSHFADIEELHVAFNGKSDVDAMLSGISTAYCKRIRNDPNFNILNLAEIERGPSIVQLTKLKKLMFLDGKEVLFSAIAVYFLLKLKSLEELKFDVSTNQINSASASLDFQQLKEKLRLAIQQRREQKNVAVEEPNE